MPVRSWVLGLVVGLNLTHFHLVDEECKLAVCKQNLQDACLTQCLLLIVTLLPDF